MPPHLHPRSAATSTLFAGTLLASFIVVGIPHVFPCPRPRRSYADSQRVQLDENGNPITTVTDAQPQQKELNSSDVKAAKGVTRSRSRDMEDEAALFQQLKEEAELVEKQARECPVPKPSGYIGRLLGFEKSQTPGDGGPKSSSSGPG